MPSIVKEFSSRNKTVRFRITADKIGGRLTAMISVSCGKSLTFINVEPVPMLFFLWELGKHDTFSDISHRFEQDGKGVDIASMYDSRTKSDRIRITVNGLGTNLNEIRVPVRYFRERAQSIPSEIDVFITALVNKPLTFNMRGEVTN
jgi:hypothetical protein